MKNSPTNQPEFPIQVSVVCPVYNEQECVPIFFERTKAVLEQMPGRHEIVFVSDGSTDETNPILISLCSDNSDVRAVLLKDNCGQSAALQAGIENSRGEYIVVIDGDLQHWPEDIPALIGELKKGYDLVSGMRVNRTDSLFTRRLPSRAANYLLRWATGCQVRDFGGFSAIRGSVAKSLDLRTGSHRYLPALVHLIGGDVREIPVRTAPRPAGNSHYNLFRVFRVAADTFKLFAERVSGGPSAGASGGSLRKESYEISEIIDGLPPV